MDAEGYDYPMADTVNFKELKMEETCQELYAYFMGRILTQHVGAEVLRGCWLVQFGEMLIEYNVFSTELKISEFDEVVFRGTLFEGKVCVISSIGGEWYSRFEHLCYNYSTIRDWDCLPKYEGEFAIPVNF